MTDLNNETNDEAQVDATEAEQAQENDAVLSEKEKEDLQKVRQQWQKEANILGDRSNFPNGLGSNNRKMIKSSRNEIPGLKTGAAILLAGMTAGACKKTVQGPTTEKTIHDTAYVYIDTSKNNPGGGNTGGTNPGGGNNPAYPKVASGYVHFGEYAEYYGQDAYQRAGDFSGYKKVTVDPATMFDPVSGRYVILPNTFGRVDLTSVDVNPADIANTGGALQRQLIQRIMAITDPATGKPTDPYLRDVNGNVVTHNGRYMLNTSNTIVQQQLVTYTTIDVPSICGAGVSLFGFDNLAAVVGAGKTDAGIAIDAKSLAGLSQGMKNIVTGVGSAKDKSSGAIILPAEKIIAAGCFNGNNYLQTIMQYTNQIQYSIYTAPPATNATDAAKLDYTNQQSYLVAGMTSATSALKALHPDQKPIFYQVTQGIPTTLPNATTLSQLAVTMGNQVSQAVNTTSTTYVPSADYVYFSDASNNDNAANLSYNLTVGAQVKGQLVYPTQVISPPKVTEVHEEKPKTIEEKVHEEYLAENKEKGLEPTVGSKNTLFPGAALPENVKVLKPGHKDLKIEYDDKLVAARIEEEKGAARA